MAASAFLRCLLVAKPIRSTATKPSRPLRLHRNSAVLPRHSPDRQAETLPVRWGALYAEVSLPVQSDAQDAAVALRVRWDAQGILADNRSEASGSDSRPAAQWDA